MNLKNWRVEPRLFLFGSHLTLVVTGFLFYDLQRSYRQIFYGVLATLTAEILGAKITRKFKRFDLWDRTLSACSIIAGLLVLVHARSEYYYAIAGSVAILSKYAIRNPAGRHIYNPTNFAIVFTLAMLPEGFINVYPDEFTIQFWPYVSVPLFGVLAVWFSGRWIVSVAYLLGNILIALALQPMLKMPFLYILAPEVGMFGLIFLFLMITDPQTTPKSKRGMVGFGLAVAFVNIFLRDFEILYSNFVALFIVVTLFQLEWLMPWNWIRSPGNQLRSNRAQNRG